MVSRFVLSIREEANRPPTTLTAGHMLLEATLRDAMYNQHHSSNLQEPWQVATGPNDGEE